MDSISHPEGHEKSVTREPEFSDVAAICRWLNEVGAKYVLVGGFAIILQGYCSAHPPLPVFSARQS